VTPFVGSPPPRPEDIQTSNTPDNDFEPNNHFVTQSIIDLSHHHRVPENEIKKREGMDWYYANYNKTPTYDIYDQPGLNSYKSGATVVSVLNPVVLAIVNVLLYVYL
jgi:hypothetical protein